MLSMVLIARVIVVVEHVINGTKCNSDNSSS